MVVVVVVEEGGGGGVSSCARFTWHRLVPPPIRSDVNRLFACNTCFKPNPLEGGGWGGQVRDATQMTRLANLDGGLDFSVGAPHHSTHPPPTHRPPRWNEYWQEPTDMYLGYLLIENDNSSEGRPQRHSERGSGGKEKKKCIPAVTRRGWGGDRNHLTKTMAPKGVVFPPTNNRVI